MERRLGELCLSKHPCTVPESETAAALISEAIRRNIALPPPADKRACALIDRIRSARRAGMDELPETGDAFFSALAPCISGKITNLNDLKKISWFEVIKNQLDFRTLSELDRLCPEFFHAPTGMTFPIDYSGEQPVLAIQIQQMYGVNKHPAVGRNQLPLRIELPSPARRPVQITCDLPGFWHGSWELVRKEMKARYPKHEWPENPAEAAPMKRSGKEKNTASDKGR
jgi:ATP-dependent helicase HrpB